MSISCPPRRFHPARGTSLVMRDPIPPAPDVPDIAGAAPDEELDSLLACHLWLDSLEPFYIDWELIWVM
jgi:hypothetical protein